MSAIVWPGWAGSGGFSWLAAVPLLALLLDRWPGEPPPRWHPVVWMGCWLGSMGRRIAPAADRSAPPRWRPFVLGALVWLLGAVVAVWLAAGVQQLVLMFPAWLALGLLAWLLKTLLSWDMLRREVLAVDAALDESLPAGRARLAWLVSRDVQALDEHQVRESAIETLAENLNDSLVAPLLCFVLLGLPGAALFRFANTADAMWGYPDAREGRQWQWAGKWAARADDVLAWLPARLTAVLVLLAAGRWNGCGLRDQARLAPSPNSGWPMAAMARVLGVRLGKPGVYELNAGARAPARADLHRACRIGMAVAWAAAVLAALACGLGWR